MYDGKIHPVRGTCYHDHRWGSAELNRMFSQWVIGRAHLGETTLVFLEMTDVVFALDSVPAIFALTREPFIVFTSNIFAILGLRALYFLLSGAVEKFHLLKYGLAAVLAFVGLKMVWLNGAFDGKFPIVWSLAIIAGAVFAAIVASLAFPRRSATATPTVSEPPAHPLAGRPR